MIVSCLGHSKFLLELENGLRIVTDPFDASCGYPVTKVACDAVLVSHHHHDHDAVDTLAGHPRIIDVAGVHTLAADVRVTAVEGFHDGACGRLRGRTLLFLIAAEGLRVVHLGDLGCPLDDKQLDVLSPADVLMIPVGGHFTIDAAQARDVCSQLRARVILPMHYRTTYTASWPLAPVDDFTALWPGVSPHQKLLRLTAGDMACQPHVAVLDA